MNTEMSGNKDGGWEVSGAVHWHVVAGVIPGCPPTSMWGALVTVLDEWEPPGEY